MKLWASCLLFAALPSLAQQPSAARPPEKCTVTGIVLKAGTDEPIRRAKVMLWPEDDGDRNQQATSDAQGRFELKGVEPGRFGLRVERDGHLVQRLGVGEVWTDGGFLRVTLTAGQELKVVAYLIPAGVITGRVLDAEGEPVVGAQVEAARRVSGAMFLGESGFMETNDLGEYRLHGLKPGRYYVRAHPGWGSAAVGSKKVSATGEAQIYVTTFYPGVAEGSEAMRVEVSAGEEARADVSLLLVRAVRVQGHLSWPKDMPFDPRTQVVLHRGGGGFWNASARARVREDGTFELDAVAPGSYMLLAYTHSTGKMQTLVRQRVEVTDAGVDDLQIVSAPFRSSPLEGRLRVEGGAEIKPGSLQVFVNPDPPEEEKDFVRFGMGFRGWVPVKSDGTFTVENLEDGRYRLRVSGEGSERQRFAEHYLKSATIGGKDVLEEGLWVRQGQAGGRLELVLSPAGARVEGVVLDDAEKPAAGVYVMAAPRTKDREMRDFETQTTDQNGQFVLRGLRPGRYTLLAWQSEGGRFATYRDPEFLKKYEDKGVSVTVQESERKSVTLRAFPLEEP